MQLKRCGWVGMEVLNWLPIRSCCVHGARHWIVWVRQCRCMRGGAESRRCYVRTSPYHADTSDCIVSQLFPFPTPKPMYDTIWQLLLVRYDLAALTCTIRSGSSHLYDMILLIIRCTISISEPHILRYLVLGAFRSLTT